MKFENKKYNHLFMVFNGVGIIGEYEEEMHPNEYVESYLYAKVNNNVCVIEAKHSMLSSSFFTQMVICNLNNMSKRRMEKIYKKAHEQIKRMLKLDHEQRNIDMQKEGIECAETYTFKWTDFPQIFIYKDQTPILHTFNRIVFDINFEKIEHELSKRLFS